MRTEHSKSIEAWVKESYLLAEEYEQIDSRDINPSMHGLKQVSRRYQSYELIAEGGMKRIFKVYDARAKRHLAMAMLKDDAPEDLSDPFIHEAWLTAMMNHPNIITIHDIGVDQEDRPYFTMDLRAGDSLLELIEKLHQGNRSVVNRYPLETLLHIYLKVCDAVAYAHSMGVLHLDLKPANIQIGEFGQVLVCDWGLAQIRGDKGREIDLDRALLNPDLLESATLFGELKGTPGSMAPEQLKKEHELDERTDVYALGALLYMMLTLKRPLTGSTEEIVQRTLEGAILSPQKRSPERTIPKALNAVVMKAMSLNAAQRYASVQALQTEVRRYMTGYATQAEEAGVPTQLRLFYRRNRSFCLMTLAGICLLLGGGVWSHIQLSKKEKAAVEARQHAERSLALYEAGVGKIEQLSLQNTESIIRLVQQCYLQGQMQRALSILDAVLKDDPDNPKLLHELGRIRFIQQLFNDAAELFSRGEHKNGVIHQLAAEYGALKADRVNALTTEQMFRLLDDLDGRDLLRGIMVRYDQQNRLDVDQRARIIEHFLRLFNPEWMNGWFDFNADQNSLRVGGQGLIHLFGEQNILGGLDLRQLDISNSDVANTRFIDKLQLERLNIQNSKITSLWNIKRISSLKELTVGAGQFPAQQLEWLPDQVRVVEL